MEFKIETMDKPTHHFDREKIYFPFDQLGEPQGDKVQGFEVPIEFKSRVNYQLNAIGLNKVQTDKEFRMIKSNKEGFFKVVRVK